MHPPERKSPDPALSEADIDALYGLEPVIETGPGLDAASTAGFVTVACPYCGECFETSADASAGPCKYVEDCQVCCQPIDMELLVDDRGDFAELRVRRSDA